jgi:hypothetical protein
MNQNKENSMSKYFVLAAALVVLAVACNKKEEVSAPAEGTTVEQTAPAEEAPAAEGTEEMPSDMPEATEMPEETPAAE